MTAFAIRRVRGLAAVLAGALALWYVFGIAAASLRSLPYMSGWVLLGMVAFLTVYNARKKLPFLPLGTSGAWLQVHIYVGLLSVAVFGFHIGWRAPSGVLEITLAGLYVAVAGSGVIGLGLSRALPARLTTRGEPVLYERLPALRAQCRDTVESLVLGAVTEHDSDTIPRLYTERLKAHFDAPRHLLHHLVQSDRPVQRLRQDISAMERYATAAERETLEAIASWVETKSALDYQYSLQSVLRVWLFVHIPLTYSLVIFAIVHVVLVHAFAGVLA